MPTEQALDNGILWLPDGPPRAAMLVLAGSSGRLEHDRARVLASRGVLAASIRYFGGPGQPPGVCEIPLETFVAGLDLLRQYHPPRIGMMGVSKGAEATLLTACRVSDLDVAMAVSPTSVVWANVGAGYDGRDRPMRSSWSWQDEPLPFVPYDDTYRWPEPPVACRPLYEASLAAHPGMAAVAAIPVELIKATLICVAGADDEMWPSDLFARLIADRRRDAGLPWTVLHSDNAGHRPYFPGEPEPLPSPRFRYGGNAAADAELGARMLARLLEALGIG